MHSRGRQQDRRTGMRRTPNWQEVSRRRTGTGRGLITSAVALAGILVVLSCGDGAVEPAPPPPAPVATTVAVNPASATLTSFGETTRFTAEVRDQNGQVMAGAAVAWATSDASVAAVDASGQVTSAANGSATITATAGSVSGTAGVTVAQAVSAVAVSPAADTLVAFGDTVRLVAEAADANGHAVAAVTEFVWSSSDTLVARVDGSGLVESLAEGEAVVMATAADVTGGADLSVVAPLPTTVAVSSDTVAFTAIGETVQLAAEVREQSGRVMGEALVSWASGDTLVAAVDSAGLVTAVGGGTTTVTAAAGDVSAAVVVTVMQSAGSVVVSPDEGAIPLGDTLRLAAEAFDENGHRVEGAMFAWSSSDAGVASVDESGLVEAVAEGTARITATAGDASGAAEITVENPDRAALVALYEATDGPNWVDNTNWLTDTPLGEWYGVFTDAAGRVIGLNLVDNGLQGVIPAEIGDLANLRFLQLALNALVAQIPPEIWGLANLESLNLGGTSLRGVIPPEIGGLAKMERLDLWNNLLTGPIPPELGGLANLKRLALFGNELTGPIPPEFRGLVSLEHLVLSDNDLTGPIPSFLGALPELANLGLGENRFTGPIPAEFGDLARLEYLTLYSNQLTGAIPSELGRLTGLAFLELYGNDLTGPIPPELRGLTHLTRLWLHSNELTGPIPPELGNLEHLEDLSLNNNKLTGPIPPELGNLRELRGLFLSGNLLTGSLPPSFAGLDNLETLGCQRTEGVCLPATDAFREWVREIEARGDFAEGLVSIPWCDEIDRDALETLYDAANGSGWTRSDGWLRDGNLGRWHGVSTDSIGRVTELDLSGNGMSGVVPAKLGRLANMKRLSIADNALSGRLPLLLARVPLQQFDYGDTSLCAADDAGFREWLNGIPRHSGTGVPCPPLTDREILEALYWATDGSNWDRSAGWLTGVPLSQWQGVQTDATGRVIELQLQYNSLSGSLPTELGQLSELRTLDLMGNTLSGPVPPQLGDLDELRSLSLHRNRLTGPIPGRLGQLAELERLDLSRNIFSGAIPPELGELANLVSLDFGRNEISGSIPPELGDLASLTNLRITDNLLSGAIPPELGDLNILAELDLARNQLSGRIPSEFGELGAMRVISLSDNQLTGGIPPHLGTLDRLVALDLSGNQLTGSIPAELGGLALLKELMLSGNRLSGSIPAELGNLGGLTILDMAGNQLSGAIPEGLGQLADLDTLNLGDNQFSGPLPPALGRVAGLENLDLRSNTLAGSVPAEYGNLTLLKWLILADNEDLVGPLPLKITALGRLERFMAGGTGLCRPPDPAFSAWFRAIPDRRLVRCAGGAAAYLTQTVQSWDDPVPLLAGEPALLRVFVTASQESAATMPAVRATFYVDGAERHSVHVAAGARHIPTEISEGDLGLSANAEIPDWVIAPGLEMVIEVDPEGTLDAALGVTKRIPESGRMAVDVRFVPPFHLTLIPFLNEAAPDSSAVEDVSAMAADPDGHELLREARMLMPIGDIDVVAREPVIVSTPNTHEMLAQVRALRLMEGGSGYWMGVWDGTRHAGTAGIAYLGGRESVSVRSSNTMAHELGHNLGLGHAPCGNPDYTDPWFPHASGRTGAWGYDFGQHRLVAPETPDVMSYCAHFYRWISDFFFNKALDHRLAAADTRATEQRTRVLLLWGGRDEDGVPYLDPAFVVDAVPSLPPEGTEYTIVGADTDGTALFSYDFDMPRIADAEGQEAGFTWALPVQGNWAGNLASITLSGRGGSATLDENTHQPMAILRDTQTGQVRAFLRNIPPATQTAADAIGRTTGQGLETLFSRGIPGAEAWRR